MVSECLQFEIPLGFTLRETQTKCKTWDMEKLLSRGNCYHRAVRRGTDAVLYSRRILCPDCQNEYGMDSHPALFYWSLGAPKLDLPCEARIREWAETAGTLFDDGREHSLLLAPPVGVPREFACPECHRVLHRTEGKRRVRLRRHRHKITLSSRITGLEEMLALQWMRGKRSISLPDTEELVLDLARGRVHVKVLDSSGAVLAQRDITHEPGTLNGGAVYRALRIKSVTDQLISMLEKEWGSPLPLAVGDGNTAALFQMTAFVGYGAAFYDSIPYTRGSWSLDRSFRRQAKALHRAADAPNLLRGSGLPEVKSVRRALFGEPGLLFYLDEICTLWQILGDVNLLCRFLRDVAAYEVLAGLHAAPGAWQYLRDLCEEKGPAYLLRCIWRDWSILRVQAVEYGAMNPVLRSRMRKQWADRRMPLSLYEPVCHYSLPMVHQADRIPDCTVQGFAFRWLRTVNDFVRAGEELDNCLTDWRPGHSEVTGIYRDGEIVAAAEIDGHKVVQARTAHNGNLSDQPALNAAFQLWMRRNGLVWDFQPVDDDDILLPF